MLQKGRIRVENLSLKYFSFNKRAPLGLSTPPKTWVVTFSHSPLENQVIKLVRRRKKARQCPINVSNTFKCLSHQFIETFYIVGTTCK